MAGPALASAALESGMHLKCIKISVKNIEPPHYIDTGSPLASGGGGRWRGRLCGAEPPVPDSIHLPNTPKCKQNLNGIYRYTHPQMPGREHSKGKNTPPKYKLRLCAAVKSFLKRKRFFLHNLPKRRPGAARCPAYRPSPPSHQPSTPPFPRPCPDVPNIIYTAL